jgi:hypothetical protein
MRSHIERIQLVTAIARSPVGGVLVANMYGDRRASNLRGKNLSQYGLGNLEIKLFAT